MISNNTFITIILIGIAIIFIGYVTLKILSRKEIIAYRYWFHYTKVTLLIFFVLMFALGIFSPIVRANKSNRKMISCSTVYDRKTEDWDFTYTYKQNDKILKECVTYKDITFVEENGSVSYRVKTVEDSFMGLDDCINVYLPKDRIEEINYSVNQGSVSESNSWFFE